MMSISLCRISPPCGYRIRAAITAALIMAAFALLLAPAPVRAQQVPQITITEGRVEPTSIAIADFTDTNGKPTREGRRIAAIIAANLADSGLFLPEAAAARIPIDPHPARPDFADWQPLGVKALVVGHAERGENGRIDVAFTLWDVVARREIVSAQSAITERGLRRVSHQISDLVFQRWTGDEGYFDTRIVYVAESGPVHARTKRLAIMDHDGHNHHYLTDGSSLVLTPRFSPQVQEIAYLDYFGDKPRIYLMDVSSGKTELLGEFPGMNFAPRFSFDGKKLIMSLARGGVTDIYEMDLATQKTTRLTASASIDTSPSYSPDGGQIAFNSDRSGNQQIYVMDVDGSNVRRISFGEGRYATPVWSPRGDLIAFTKLYRDSFYIGVMNTDGTGERIIAGGFAVEAPTWAPNGRTLIYFKQEATDRRGAGGDSYLYRIDITGFNEKRLPTPAFASDPAWSSRQP